MSDYTRYSAHCWACQQPVPSTAYRCPHCTSELGQSGSNPNAPVTGATELWSVLVAYLLIGGFLEVLAPVWVTVIYWWPAQALGWLFMRLINLLEWILF